MSWRRLSDLKRHAGKGWYPLLLGGVALADHFVFFFPIDALLVGSSLLAPTRRFLFAIATTLGSALGALILGALIAHFGEPFVLRLAPEVDSHSLWQEFQNLIWNHGFLGLTLIAASPFALQPAIVVAGLGEMSLASIFAASFVGRGLKSFAICSAVRLRG